MGSWWVRRGGDGGVVGGSGSCLLYPSCFYSEQGLACSCLVWCCWIWSLLASCNQACGVILHLIRQSCSQPWPLLRDRWFIFLCCARERRDCKVASEVKLLLPLPPVKSLAPSLLWPLGGDVLPQIWMDAGWSAVWHSPVTGVIPMPSIVPACHWFEGIAASLGVLSSRSDHFSILWLHFSNSALQCMLSWQWIEEACHSSNVYLPFSVPPFKHMVLSRTFILGSRFLPSLSYQGLGSLCLFKNLLGSLLGSLLWISQPGITHVPCYC